MAPIYFGSKKVDILGISKAYKGNTLVYQKNRPVPPPIPSDDYFTLINRSDDTRAVQIIFHGDASGLLGWPELLYSYDGTNWQRYSIDSQTKQGQELSVNAGYYVQFRNLNQYFSYKSSPYTLNHFEIKALDDRYDYQDWEVSGNILSLINYQQMQAGCFEYLFSHFMSLYKAENLILPNYATEYCYNCMFQGATSLAYPPVLPATTLAANCYYDMFHGCISLTIAPTMLATTLAYECCFGMFTNCTLLTIPPALPATKLAERCYFNMFYGCISLSFIPELPATKLLKNCYGSMFSGCDSIELSRSQHGKYTNAYRIPPTGTATSQGSATSNMFVGTGGEIPDTPDLNTTYYTSNTIIPAN